MKYDEFIERVRRQHGERFDDSRLNQTFVQFYNNGNRIEVEINGEKKRGRIGITTGWKPSFLLMLTKRSLGSAYLIDEKTRFIKVVSV